MQNVQDLSKQKCTSFDKTLIFKILCGFHIQGKNI